MGLFKESISLSPRELLFLSSLFSPPPQLSYQAMPELSLLAGAKGGTAGYSLYFHNRISLAWSFWDAEQLDVCCASGFGSSTESSVAFSVKCKVLMFFAWRHAWTYDPGLCEPLSLQCEGGKGRIHFAGGETEEQP